MSTIVYQGLQSCLESQLIEPRTLMFKLALPRPHFSQSFEIALKTCPLDSDSMKLMKEKYQQSEDILTANNSSSSNPKLGGWTFLQTLPNISQTSNEKESSYVHPLAKHSSSSLSVRSLELCTENLGSETGTDIIEDSIFAFSCLDTENGNSNSPRKEYSKKSQVSEGRKTSFRNFPPPLTTMRGPDSLQVRPRREEGRLVLKAVKTPLKSSCFQAERSNGRLRLCFLENDSEDEVNAVNSKGNDIEESMNDQLTNEEHEKEEEEEEEEESEGLCLSESVNGNNLDIGAKTGMGKFQRRPSMCKEGGNKNKDGLLNLEACWVATS